MKYCTKCGKELFDEAVICPGCGCATERYCGASSDAGSPQLTATPPSAFGNVSEGAWQQFCKSRVSYAILTERDEAALYAQCVEYQLLKAPTTARFPQLSEMSVIGSNGRYTVSGFVDSQNSYGANIRTQYTYNVEKDAVGKWRCTNQFVSTSSQIQQQMIGNTVLWWVLGIIGTLITFGVASCSVNSMF